MTAREALALVALVAAVVAAIANIVALRTSGMRRTLLAAFFLASLVLVVFVSKERTASQEEAIREARLELEMQVLQHRSAVAEANRRIEQERRSYEIAVNEALAKMQADFRQQLEENAKELMAASHASDEAYEQIKRLVETRESLRRQDVRNFLKGDWTSSPPPKKTIIGLLVTNVCTVTFTETTIHTHQGGALLYEISEIQGNRVFIRLFASGGVVNIRLLTLDIENDSFLSGERVCVRKT